MTRNGTLPCELVDSSDFLIDCLSEFKGVEGFKEFSEGVFGFFFDVFGFEDSLVRSFGFIVALDGLGGNSFFGQEFDGGDEKVVIETPLGFIEIV